MANNEKKDKEAKTLYQKFVKAISGRTPDDMWEIKDNQYDFDKPLSQQSETLELNDAAVAMGTSIGSIKPSKVSSYTAIKDPIRRQKAENVMDVLNPRDKMAPSPESLKKATQALKEGKIPTSHPAFQAIAQKILKIKKD